MKVSACITINKRSIADLAVVFESMRKQEHDEFIIVLDRPEPGINDYARSYWKDDSRTRFIDIIGEPGWKSPVTAWNKGFEAVTGDVVYCFSSETIQAPGNVARAKALLVGMDRAIQGKAVCSCGPEGQEVNWGGSAPGNLLCDAAHPRPLGFIWAAPMDRVRSIGGYDPFFAGGLWYDDADFFLRLWKTGLNFLFADSIHGIHLHHDRPGLATPEGQAGIQRNAALMQQKHGTVHPWNSLPRITTYGNGWTEWKHV